LDNLLFDQRLSPEKVLSALMENAPVLISAKDREGNVLMANRHFKVLKGFDHNLFVGRNVFDIFPKEIAMQLWNNDLKVIETGAPQESEEMVEHVDGGMHTYSTVKFPLRDDKNMIYAVCAISYDITDAKEALSQSLHDDLTGLYNRRYFNKVVGSEIKRSSRGNLIFAFLLLDVDRFKLYNDTYGHEEGDSVLQRVGEVLQSTCHRASDFCFRIGGEEFVILSSFTNVNDALSFSQGVCDAIAALDIPHCKNPPHDRLTCSIGVSTCGPRQKNVTQSLLYSLADKALYQAKDASRCAVAHLTYSDAGF